MSLSARNIEGSQLLCQSLAAFPSPEAWARDLNWQRAMEQAVAEDRGEWFPALKFRPSLTNLPTAPSIKEWTSCTTGTEATFRQIDFGSSSQGSDELTAQTLPPAQHSKAAEPVKATETQREVYTGQEAVHRDQEVPDQSAVPNLVNATISAPMVSGAYPPLLDATQLSPLPGDVGNKFCQPIHQNLLSSPLTNAAEISVRSPNSVSSLPPPLYRKAGTEAPLPMNQIFRQSSPAPLSQETKVPLSEITPIVGGSSSPNLLSPVCDAADEPIATSSVGRTPPPVTEAQSGLRLHVERSDEGLHLWVGLDIHANFSQDQLLAQLQRWVAAHEERLVSLVCNGKSLLDGPQRLACEDANSPEFEEFAPNFVTKDASTPFHIRSPHVAQRN